MIGRTTPSRCSSDGATLPLPGEAYQHGMLARERLNLLQSTTASSSSSLTFRAQNFLQQNSHETEAPQQQQQRLAAAAAVRRSNKAARQPAGGYRRPNFVERNMHAEKTAFQTKRMIAQRYRTKSALNRVLQSAKQHAENEQQASPLASEQDVQSLLSIIGASCKNLARYYLERNHGDLNAAVNMYFGNSNLYHGPTDDNVKEEDDSSRSADSSGNMTPRSLAHGVVLALFNSSLSVLSFENTNPCANWTSLMIGTKRFFPDDYYLTGYPAELVGAAMRTAARPEIRGRNDVDVCVRSSCVVIVALDPALSALGLPAWMEGFVPMYSPASSTASSASTSSSTPQRMLVFTHASENKDLCMLLYKKMVPIDDDAKEKEIMLSLGSSTSQASFVVMIQSMQNDEKYEMYGSRMVREIGMEKKKEEEENKEDEAGECTSLLQEILHLRTDDIGGIGYVLTNWEEYGSNENRTTLSSSSSSSSSPFGGRGGRSGRGGRGGRGGYGMMRQQERAPLPSFDGHQHSSMVPNTSVPVILRSHSHQPEIDDDDDVLLVENEGRRRKRRERLMSPRPSDRSTREIEATFIEHMRRRKVKAEMTRCYQLAVKHGFVTSREMASSYSSYAPTPTMTTQQQQQQNKRIIVRRVGSVTILRRSPQQQTFGSISSPAAAASAAAAANCSSVAAIPGDTATHDSLNDSNDTNLAFDEISSQTMNVVILPPQISPQTYRMNQRGSAGVPDWRIVRYQYQRAAQEEESAGSSANSAYGSSYGMFGRNNWEEVGLDDFLLMMDSVKNPWNLRDILTQRVRRRLAKDAAMLAASIDGEDPWNVETNEEDDERVHAIVSSLLSYSIDKGKNFAQQFYFDSDEEMFSELVRAESRLISRLKKETPRLEPPQFTFGQQAHAFGQQAHAFGQQAQTFGQQAQAFGQQVQAFGSSPPQPPPAFGSPPQLGLDSSFGGIPPSLSFTYQDDASSNFEFGATSSSEEENGAAFSFGSSRTTSRLSSTAATSSTASSRRRRRNKTNKK